MARKKWLGCSSIVALGVGCAMLIQVSRAEAACSPTTSSNPPVGTIVTCTGNVSNQDNPNGYGTGTQTGLSINVNKTFSVTGSNDGIFLDNKDIGNFIGNSGAINGTGKDGVEALGTTGLLAIGNAGSIVGNINGISANLADIVNQQGGLISGVSGISLTGTAASSSIDNSGTINGTGGVAIRFAPGSAGNTLSLGTTSQINGEVLGAGADILQFGGTGGNGTFNVSDIGGAQAQYQGFSTFNKIGTSSWTLAGSGAQNQNWTISQGTLIGDSNSLQGNKLSVANNATLEFKQDSGGGTYGGVISGAGSLVKDGSSVLTLTGANTYSGPTVIRNGELNVDTNSIKSNTISNNSVLFFNQSVDGTYAGSIESASFSRVAQAP